VLGRCHSRKRHLFRGGEQVELRAGLLTWVAGKTAHAYVPRTGRAFQWALPGAESAHMTHTATHVFLTATGGGDSRVYSARWRRAPAS
jgi:DNA polymerase III alpha subunit (gram-positive type)